MTEAVKSTDSVAVIGAGSMGAGIAQVAAAAGHPVLLYDAKGDAVVNAIERLDAGLAKLAGRGKITGEERAAIIGRIKPVANLSDMAPAKLVIEAIIEDLKIKQSVFQELEGIVTADAILATNTSSLSITAIGEALERPGKLVGMHFFNPAQIMKLVEVVSGLQTEPAVAETVYATAKNWGKIAVYAKSVPGFIVNRVARPYYSEAFQALREGAAGIAAIDHILKTCAGFRMGPFELVDLVGQDINAAVSRSVYNAYFHTVRFRPSLIQEEYVAAGRLGRKSGSGFYGEGGADPDPVFAPAEDKISGPDFQPAGITDLGDVCLARTDGRMATERTEQEDRITILFDYASDYAATGTIAIAPCDQASEKQITEAVGYFQAMGKKVLRIDDHPGMIALRTIAMLANTAADAVRDGVSDPASIDQAMKYGVNYPKGPLEWADEIGLPRILTALNNIADITGDNRYLPSQYIRRRVAAGKNLRD